MAELTKEEKYIKYKFLYDNAVLYKDIAKYENMAENEVRRKYKTIDEWLTEKIYGENTQENRDIFSKDISNDFRKYTQKIMEKFTDERKFGFGKDDKKDDGVFLEWVELAQRYHKTEWDLGDDKDKLLERYNNGDFGFKTFARFYKWYESQPKECYYCGTTQEQLDKLFKKNDTDESEWDKILYSKKTGFTAELQVEKLNPNKPYNESNCKLACAFCNNAKSDMVNADNFKKFAENHIKPLLDGFLSGVSNEMPFFEAKDSSQYQK